MHHGVISGGEPKDPKVAQKREFVGKVRVWEIILFHSLIQALFLVFVKEYLSCKCYGCEKDNLMNNCFR